MTDAPPFLAVQTVMPLQLRMPLTAGHDEPTRYQPPPGLKEAMDVAMMLGEPIVLTGPPGCGKTQAAHWLAHQLNAGDVLRFDVKSTTLGGDLLYAFDDVARFRDAAASGLPGGGVKPLVRYLRFSALGLGILRAAGPDSVLYVGEDALKDRSAIRRHRRLLDDAFGPGWDPPDGRACVADLLAEGEGPALERGQAASSPDLEEAVAAEDSDPMVSGSGREVRVVLIDELDKAPRDTPNDLLAEVERMTFLIGELGLRVRTDKAVRPIVVITSNAEKPLPEPFLRRCAYFDVPRLKGATLAKVIQENLRVRQIGDGFAGEVAEVADRLNASQDAIQRKPGAAEVLAWSEVLVRYGAGRGLKAWISGLARARPEPQGLENSLTALLKHAEDQKAALAMILDWADERRTKRVPA
jgi:MoxR-like ATPase